MDPASLLAILVIGALMGMLGQGARAVVGLKGMSDDAKAQGLSPNDLFEAARLITSLLIGALVGLVSSLTYIIDGGTAAQLTWHYLVAWAAAAYAGTDALEGFISQYLSPGAKTAKTTTLMIKSPRALSAEDIVHNAFAMLHKPEVNDNDKLSESPIGFSSIGDYDGLLDKINLQLADNQILPFSAAKTWQTTTDARVTIVVASVQSALNKAVG